MEKEKGKTRQRNKNKSKQDLINAVGELLTTKGYSSLKVNNIAATAGLDKKLIYKYFGGTEELLDEYILSQDFWANITSEKIPQVINDGGKELTKLMLTSQFDFLEKNEELQKILHWSLSEERKSLKNLIETQEKNGEMIFATITDKFFGEKSREFRAISAIMVSGIYYLNMYAKKNGSVFCGIDLNEEEGKQEIKNAIKKMVDKIYEKE